MGPALVATKLQAPRLRPGAVARPELVQRLISGADRKATLVCAPAGWGKTVLLCEWLAASDEGAFAWVSLDRGDDDPVRFWSYVIAALHSARPGFGEQALAALPSAGPDLVDAVVTPLINELATDEEPVVLVLDDYHAVHGEAIHASLGFLLRHLPEGAHVAISTRSDPPLPLPGLRASDELTEIRAAELRFTDAEANEFLNGSLSLALRTDDIERLQRRTEGWAAGLQLAALSIRGQDDRRAFIASFSGDDRQVGEYLHEVLAEQPAELREFLLRTSILERLSAPLCAAVTGDEQAAERLDEAARANLFLIELDHRREWFRYHQLFAELLRQELHRVGSEAIPDLHRRASAWSRANDDVDGAIAHATAAGDFGEAGELIKASWRSVGGTGRYETLASWIDALPSDVVTADPGLCVIRGRAALELGRFDEAGRWLRESERDDVDRSVLLTPGDDSVEANAWILRGLFANLSGDIGRAVTAGRRAVAHLSKDSFLRPNACVVLGEVLYYAGDLEGSVASLEEGLGELTPERSLPATVGGLCHLALAQVDAGENQRARATVDRCERLIATYGLAESPWTTPLVRARAKLDLSRGDRGAARVSFTRAVVLARRGQRRPDLAAALIGLSQLSRVDGETIEARSLAKEARSVLASCPDPGPMLGDLIAAEERALQLTRTRRDASTPAVPALSERELAVLRLLPTELNQREIASELFVSFNTVKSQVRSVFVKLDVRTRAEAVARGRELGLL